MRGMVAGRWRTGIDATQNTAADVAHELKIPVSALGRGSMRGVKKEATARETSGRDRA
ncbi:MAG: hypothetical protein IPF96_15675 [Rhodobacter sp.]|nr:hypothetical protein [Rhodobacter sp.]